MTAKNSDDKEFKVALVSNTSRYNIELTFEQIARLSQYHDLLSAWNPRLHLVGPCSAREFATRHVLESLLLLHYLPQGAKLADVGSGGGLPIIPCLIVRPDLEATLIESSKKKAIFLSEALNRVAATTSANVVAERFEAIKAPEVEYITSRALERFRQKLPTLMKWSPTTSTLLLFGGASLREAIEQAGLEVKQIRIPNSERRFLFVVKKG
jgi:16S rRNA (guanine527-N7)-methyltransferase